MAKDYADSLAKHVKAKEALSNNWFYSFLKWWSNLKVVKPQKLSIARAKSASRETLDNYYKELSTGLERYTPEYIHNIDEIGVLLNIPHPKLCVTVALSLRTLHQLCRQMSQSYPVEIL